MTVGANGITAKLDSGNEVTTIYANQTTGTDDAKSKSFRFEVVNNPGYELPNTGGIGTGLFYPLGIGLIGLSIALMLSIRFRRSCRVDCFRTHA